MLLPPEGTRAYELVVIDQAIERGRRQLEGIDRFRDDSLFDDLLGRDSGSSRAIRVSRSSAACRFRKNTASMTRSLRLCSASNVNAMLIEIDILQTITDGRKRTAILGGSVMVTKLVRVSLDDCRPSSATKVRRRTCRLVPRLQLAVR